MSVRSGGLGWIADRSLSSIRAGLREVAPFLSSQQIQINDRVLTSDPRYFRSSAVVGGRFMVMFAWSEPAARRVVHESEVLGALSATAPALPIPEVVASSVNPAMLVTRIVPSRPLTFEAASTPDPERRARLAEGLGRFLAGLHSESSLLGVQGAGVSLGPPVPQADTDALRRRFPRLVDHGEGTMVERWCDWVDQILTSPSEDVLLHGDLHGYNILCDTTSCGVLLVVDFETASLGDLAFDFRYLPGQAATVDLFMNVVETYENFSDRTVGVDRVLAWNIRTSLGDALWRSEASVGLPGGGTPSSWVKDMAIRMDRLGY